MEIRRNLSFWIVLLLSLILFIDYYCQFFTSTYWHDHALPFLQKIK